MFPVGYHCFRPYERPGKVIKVQEYFGFVRTSSCACVCVCVWRSVGGWVTEGAVEYFMWVTIVLEPLKDEEK